MRYKKCKYLNSRRGKDQLLAIFHYNVFVKFHLSFVVRAQKLFSSSFFSKITILLSRNLSPSHFDKWTNKIQVTILFQSHLAADSGITQSLGNKSNKRIHFLFYSTQPFNRDDIRVEMLILLLLYCSYTSKVTLFICQIKCISRNVARK